MNHFPRYQKIYKSTHASPLDMINYFLMKVQHNPTNFSCYYVHLHHVISHCHVITYHAQIGHYLFFTCGAFVNTLKMLYVK